MTATEGTKSTEFISAWAASAAAAGYGLTSPSETVQAAALIAMGLAIGLYCLGRGIAKRGASS